MIKTELSDGAYILMSEDSEIDPESLFPPDDNENNKTRHFQSLIEESLSDSGESNEYSFTNIIKKIELIKDGKIYIGAQKSFKLEETKSGKTKISVVFYLDP